jgi:hypothetical protein
MTQCLMHRTADLNLNPQDPHKARSNSAYSPGTFTARWEVEAGALGLTSLAYAAVSKEKEACLKQGCSPEVVHLWHACALSHTTLTSRTQETFRKKGGREEGEEDDWGYREGQRVQHSIWSSSGVAQPGGTFGS